MSQPEEALASGDQENSRDKIITELTRANGVLKANISTLYRTARAEIARKNDRIAELQSDLDDILFKRMSNRASQSGNNSRSSQSFSSSTKSSADKSSQQSQNDSLDYSTNENLDGL